MLSGKTPVITGGSSCIGKAVAERYLEEGAVTSAPGYSPEGVQKWFLREAGAVVSHDDAVDPSHGPVVRSPDLKIKSFVG